MINRDAIISDLVEGKLTRGQIAEKNECSYVTVSRIIREHNLFIGRGKRPSSIWKFKETSEPLLYLVGIYITDGNLGFDNDGYARQFVINNSNRRLIIYSSICLKKIGLTPKISTRHNHSSHLGTKIISNVSAYNSDFSKWVSAACNYKENIPDVIFNAPIAHQLAFLAGIIDGDGHVTNMGSIRIRGVDMWLSQLPRLLSLMNIRTTGFKKTATLPSGTDYNMVSIRRSDFRSLGGWCVSTEKMERIQNAKDERRIRNR